MSLIQHFGSKISGLVFTFGVMVAGATGFAATGGLSEGLLIEADVKQGSQVLVGRVLMEAGRSEWTTIAESKSKKTASRKAQEVLEQPLKLEARATLIEADVVEIETRITGRNEQNGKLIVRLGERAEMTTSQMESTETAATTSGASAKAPLPTTSIGLKVLRVRYSL